MTRLLPWAESRNLGKILLADLCISLGSLVPLPLSVARGSARMVVGVGAAADGGRAEVNRGQTLDRKFDVEDGRRARNVASGSQRYH